MSPRKRDREAEEAAERRVEEEELAATPPVAPSIEAEEAADEAAVALAGSEHPPGERAAAVEEAPQHPVPEDPVLAELAAAHPTVRFELVEPPAGPAQDVAHAPREAYRAFMQSVREAGYRQFADLCGVDYLRRRPRFEVVVNVVSHDRPGRLRVRVGVPGDDLVVDTLTDVYPGAGFYERETYDMYGIEFAGHPDLTRILMPDDWEGHPLRKDYAVGSVPVQFKEAHRAT